MAYLSSDAFLDLLTQQRVLSPRQRQFIEQNREKQGQKLLRQFGGRRHDDENRHHKGFPDLIDLILSFGMETPGPNPVPLTEELMLRVVSRALKLPFTMLDPLKLDMEVVTKTIA